MDDAVRSVTYDQNFLEVVIFFSYDAFGSLL